MLNLIWETDSRSQFKAILNFIGGRDLNAAIRIRLLILERVERLRSFPEIGRPGRVAGTRELIVHPNYVVIYQVKDNAIDILRVLHSRQRYP